MLARHRREASEASRGGACCVTAAGRVLPQGLLQWQMPIQWQEQVLLQGQMRIQWQGQVLLQGSDADSVVLECVRRTFLGLFARVRVVVAHCACHGSGQNQGPGYERRQ
jgi:hypothetical protein